MKTKKTFSFFLIIFIVSFCSGCSSFFIRKGAAITDYSQTSGTVNVISLVEPGIGILEDVSIEGDAMLVFSNSQAPPITYNIEIYQKNTNGKWSAINFLNSEKPHISGVFSSKNDGIYYTENILSNDAEDEISQLVWMSLDRKTTRVLSLENESITTDLYRISDGKVLCANDKHQFLMIDNSGQRIARNINADYSIQDIAYDEENKKLYFTGKTDESQTLNLYVADLSDNNIKPVQIDLNILSCDYNIIDGKLLYIKKTSSETQLILFDCQTESKMIITDTLVNQAVLNDDATAILYSTPVSQNNSRLQIIQIMDIETKENRQLTSPRSLSSLLYSRKHALFSSVVDEESINNSLYDSRIFTLTYE